jgi:diguanylate cyclase
LTQSDWRGWTGDKFVTPASPPEAVIKAALNSTRVVAQDRVITGVAVDGRKKLQGAAGFALAHGTIDVLSDHQIPASPPNYEIWTAHRLGAFPDLSKEIDARLAKAEPFTEEVNDDLFERYFSSTRLAVQVIEASGTIARELTEAVATLRQAGEQSGSYANTLESAATTFEEGVDANGFRSLLANLTLAARDMAVQNQQMSQQMTESSRQVETLQAALQTVKVQALTDGLTGLANRKYFDETLRRRLQESTPNDGGFCLLMCDIDHFKRFNDTWGHLVGDQVIRFIANALRLHATGDLLAARYGGEEFAIIMPRTTLSQAQSIATAIREMVRSKKLTRKSTNESLGNVTLSIGLAQRRANESANDIIARADACLYASKRAGRDRITSDKEVDTAAA